MSRRGIALGGFSSVALGLLVTCTVARIGERIGSTGEAVTVGPDDYAVSGIAPWGNTAIQSETALAVAYDGATSALCYQPLPIGRRLVMAYNNIGDPNAVVCAGGPSLLGAYYSDDLGKTWTASTFPAVNANATYNVQWVDPAAIFCPTTTKPNRVFVGSLAKYNVAGCATSQLKFNNPAAYSNGACIYVSDDMGASFSLDSCMPSSPASQNYDGASFACASDGTLYAAFRDANNNSVPVWKRDPSTGAYTSAADPGYNSSGSYRRSAILASSFPAGTCTSAFPSTRRRVRSARTRATSCFRCSFPARRVGRPPSRRASRARTSSGTWTTATSRTTGSSKRRRTRTSTSAPQA